MTCLSKRRFFWDNLKGILIFLVVFAHFLYGCQNNEVVKYIVDAIYLFHMPAFIFVSGYLSKSENSRMLSSLAKLGVIYLIFNSVMMIFFGITEKSFSAVTPYYSTWYLLALIVWRAAAKYLARVKYIVPWLVVAAMVSGLWRDIDNTLAVSRIICFLPFFMAGYLFEPEKMEKRVSPKTPKLLLGGAGCLILAAIAVIFALETFTYTSADLVITEYIDISDAIKRALMFIVSFLAIEGLTRLTPDRNIPFVNQIGRNSLSIYMWHRPVTLLCEDFLRGADTAAIIGMSVALSLLVCVVFGSDKVSALVGKLVDFVMTKLLSGKARMSAVTKLACLVFAAFVVLSPAISNRMFLNMGSLVTDEETSDDGTSAVAQSGDVYYNILTPLEKTKLDNSFTILFSGDLILLEDQVKNGYTGEGYDFSDMFEYTAPYISSADMAIGVFEGPLAGEKEGYTSSNYGDGKALYLNFPDGFATDVKNAGYDLVTLANNHILDKGREGALRTIDVLDGIGLDNTGSYRSAEEKADERVKIIENDGIKFAVLSYTYGSNYYTEEHFIGGDFAYVTSVLVPPESENFGAVKESVRLDFEEAKSHNPDIILVLPHMGTQFLDAPDEYQKAWCGIFREYGADIILSDHTHSVQPIEIESVGGKTVFTAHCPGNYANIYREHNGDASALVEVYIDRTTKEVIGGGIIPMWTYSNVDGNYTPVPIYDIVNNSEVRKGITTDDMERVEEVHGHITSVMLGERVGMDMAQERYYYNSNGFARTMTEEIRLTDEMKSGEFWQKCKNAESICFVGDSVTEGTKNGGCPWYEPIVPHLDGEIYNCSWGGGTVQTLLDNAQEIKSTHADLYVIAIGTNDVRYRDEQTCAMTSEEYISRLENLCSVILSENGDAEFVFIAPWTSTDGDPFCSMSYNEKMRLNAEYSDALENMCDENGYVFINPNGYIDGYLRLYPTSEYLLDHIHPGYRNGVRLYSEAVLLSE